MPTPSWIGQTLGGRYQIETLLGQGGMSAVYKARDPNLRRTVAIKLIHSHLASDREFVRRFEEEASSVAGLRHPNIVQVFDFNHDEDTYYMVLEFVSGQSLHERLVQLHDAGRRLPIEETVRLVSVVGEAVHYAHERGLIHRDLKPANIMINAAGEPILMDFGVAKIVGGKQFTATGAIIGTPAYIAPELVRGGRPDRRADLYSLGVMLFEMLAGQLPFDADSAMSLMLKHLSEPVPDLRQLAPSLPPAIVAAVERSLAKDPDKRFQTALEMRQALQTALTGRTTAPAGGTGRATLPPSEPLPPARAKTNPLWIFAGVAAAAVCGLAVLAALAGGLALRGFGAPASTPTLPAPTVASVTQPPSTLAVVSATEAPTQAPTDTAAPAPTDTAQAAPTPTVAPPTAPPTAAAPTSTPATFYAQITGIRIENARYVVDFVTFNYQSHLPGMHIHLFFNTVPQSQAGAPGGGPWFVHGGETPVSPYAVSDRPPGATQMCILVANPDHSIILNSGNCVNLP